MVSISILFAIAFVLAGVYAFHLSYQCDQWEEEAHHWKTKHDRVQQAAAVIATWLKENHPDVFRELNDA